MSPKEIFNCACYMCSNCSNCCFYAVLKFPGCLNKPNISSAVCATPELCRVSLLHCKQWMVLSVFHIRTHMLCVLVVQIICWFRLKFRYRTTWCSYNRRACLQTYCSFEIRTLFLIFRTNASKILRRFTTGLHFPFVPRTIVRRHHKSHVRQTQCSTGDTMHNNWVSRPIWTFSTS